MFHSIIACQIQWLFRQLILVYRGEGVKLFFGRFSAERILALISTSEPPDLFPWFCCPILSHFLENGTHVFVGKGPRKIPQDEWQQNPPKVTQQNLWFSGTKIQPKEEVLSRISLQTSGQKLRSGPPNPGKTSIFARTSRADVHEKNFGLTFRSLDTSLQPDQMGIQNLC